MSFSFESHAGTGEDVYGHNDTKDGNPAGGHAACQYGEAGDKILHDRDATHFAIRWQDGPVDREAGEKANGAFVEDVIDVCKRRLEFYEDSPFACPENAEAIDRADPGA